jgi:SAM-dependent methyltransferase
MKIFGVRKRLIMRIYESPCLLKFARLFNRTIVAYLPKVHWPIFLRYYKYFKDLSSYRKLECGEQIDSLNLWPCLNDKVSTTPVEYLYFYQDTWASSKIFHAEPEHHVDIGSTALFVGIISRFTKTYSVDVRPLAVRLNGLECIKGNITALPFKDNSLLSVSSLCVIEHIGLGRYGDPLDPKGTDKAMSELLRVLAADGSLYFSIPIANKNTVYFNAHRAFNVDTFVKRFHSVEFAEIKFVQGNTIYAQDELNRLDLSRHTVGLFHLIKLK